MYFQQSYLIDSNQLAHALVNIENQSISNIIVYNMLLIYIKNLFLNA